MFHSDDTRLPERLRAIVLGKHEADPVYKSVPVEYHKQLRYVDALTYYDEPNYADVHRAILTATEILGIDMGAPLDWIGKDIAAAMAQKNRGKDTRDDQLDVSSIFCSLCSFFLTYLLPRTTTHSTARREPRAPRTPRTLMSRTSRTTSASQMKKLATMETPGAHNQRF